MSASKTVKLSESTYWATIDQIRRILNSKKTECEASDFIDRLMQTESGNKMLLDAFCESSEPVNWWGVFYRDWC